MSFKYKYKKMLQTIAFFLVICLANGYVFAILPGEKSPDEAKHKEVSSGILNSSGDQSVLVNGNAAFNGMTILSGAVIKTGKNSGATINLPQIGLVELTSETTVKLVFTSERVDLQLLNGKAKLTTFKSINGSLIGTDGIILTTDPTLETSSVGGWETTNRDVPLPVPISSTGLFGMGMLGTLAALGGVIGGAALVWVTATNNNNENQTVSSVQP